jgi:aminomethyltransferase
MEQQLKKTSLYERHVSHGGKMVPFGGWEMPVQYSGIKDEHLAVRKHGGLFDICHMGEFKISGPAAKTFLNHLLTNNVEKLQPGDGQYSLMCLATGGVVDDLYLYCLETDVYLMIVNASRLDADWQWMQKALEAGSIQPENIRCEDLSNQLGAVAVQGPKVRSWIDSCFTAIDPGNNDSRVSQLKKNQIGAFQFENQKVWIGATGYTGEDGFEVIASNDTIPVIWDMLLAKGHVGCLQPAGLGARDTLRTEMCYPLYGHELTTETTPMEAGLGFFLDLEKGDFMGRAALLAQKEKGIQRRCVAFQMTGRSAPPRPDYPVLSGDGERIGIVTSGTSSPSLNNGIGMAYINTASAKPGQNIAIEIRGRSFPAEIVKKPIYRRA